MSTWRAIVFSGCVACSQSRQSAAIPVIASAPIASESKEWYRTATLHSSLRARGTETVRTCAVVARDSTAEIGYTCDVVVLTLRPAAQIQAISGLLIELSGTVGRVFGGPHINVVEIRVPMGTELAAIQRAYADSNVARASLDLERIGAF